jgi:hypothetical protein
MIRQNKRGYVEFINGIKDGMTWEDALRDKYGVTLDQLVNAYGISMTVANLKPSRQGAQSQEGTEPRQGTQSQQGGQCFLITDGTSAPESARILILITSEQG